METATRSPSSKGGISYISLSESNSDAYTPSSCCPTDADADDASVEEDEEGATVKGVVDDDAVEVCNDDEPNLETTGAAGARACARARAATTGCVPPIDWSATRSDVNEAKALDDGSEVISSYVTRRWRLGKGRGVCDCATTRTKSDAHSW